MVKLRTYGGDNHEIDFTVNETWLEKKIDVPLEEFLDSYTFDESELLFVLAKREGAVLETQIV